MIEMPYFKLFPDVFLIQGNRGAVIQGTTNRKAFALDDEYAELLSYTDSGLSLEEAGECAGITLERVLAIVEEVQTASLGKILDTNAYVEKIDTSPKWKDDLVFSSPPRIDRVFVQFGGSCDRNCTYCGSEDRALSVSCWQCVPTPEAPISRLEEAILEVSRLAPAEIIISCPPTVDACSLGRVIDSALSAASKVTVATDSTISVDLSILEKDRLMFFLKLDINSLTLPEVQEWVLGLPLNCVVQVVVDGDSTPPEPYIKLLESQGVQVAMAEVIELGENTVENRIISEPCEIKNFSYRVNHNSCLSTSLTIRADGAVFQCPRLPALRLADEFDAVSALRSDLFMDLSGMSMNRVTPCNSCEMRYLCSDCRYLELASGASSEGCVRCRRMV